MPNKTVLLGTLTELGTDTANGFLKRNSGNTDWEQVAYGLTAAVAAVGTANDGGSANAPARIDHVHDLSFTTLNSVFGEANADFLMGGSGAYKIKGLGGVELESGADRTIKISDNDNSRKLYLKSGDAVSADTGTGDLVLDTGAKLGTGVAGKVQIALTNASELSLGRAAGKIGFFGATPVVLASAYTQTYSTADRTQAALTSATLTDSTGGTPGTTISDCGATYSQSTMNNNVASLVAQINALRVDLEDVKQISNALIDDLQAYGLAQ